MKMNNDRRAHAAKLLGDCGYATGGRVRKPSIKPRAIRSAPMPPSIAAPVAAGPSLGDMAGMKRGGKVKGYAKGGKVTAPRSKVAKMACGGAAKIRHGAADPSGKPTRPSTPSAKSKMTRPKTSGK